MFAGFKISIIFTSSTIEQLQGEWIYMVDPETMNEVKSIYRNSKENVSLYGVFCKLLKQQ